MPAPKGNKNALGNKGGHPPLWKDPKELSKKVDEYFTNCPDKRDVITDAGVFKVDAPTVTGLALHLGFNSRQTLLNYEGKVEFMDLIKKAKARIEMSYEQRLHVNGCTGAIFVLKNMGWSDRQEIDHTTKGNEIKTFSGFIFSDDGSDKGDKDDK